MGGSLRSVPQERARSSWRETLGAREPPTCARDLDRFSIQRQALRRTQYFGASTNLAR